MRPVALFCALLGLAVLARPPQTAPALVATPAAPPATSRERWAMDLAAALGNTQPSAELVAFLVAWQRAEGGSEDNPLNTTQNVSGAAVFNNRGVKRYGDYAVGLQATVTTLGYTYPGYAEIVAGIQANNPDRALAGLYASPWGTSASLVEQVYHEELAALARPAAASCPVDPCVRSGYGFEPGSHPGIDLGASAGQPVYATLVGIVEQYANSWPGGNCVFVRSGTLATLACHLSSFATQDGAQVQPGAVVGYAGATGLAYGVHVHFEVRQDGQSVDPVPYLGVQL